MAKTDTPLRKLRKKLGLTTTEAGAACGIDQSTFHRIETGAPTSPKIAEQIVQYFEGEHGAWITELHILYPDRFPDFLEERRRVRV